MTAPPLPASACFRIRLGYQDTDGHLAGNRFYLSFTGSASSVGDLNTLATDIATTWNTDIAPGVHSDWALTEVDVLDITTDSGHSGLWTGAHNGTGTGNTLPANCAVNVEFVIARRYRGGKPRIFWPPPGDAALGNAMEWTAGAVTAFQTGTINFFTAIEALTVGAIGTLAHVNVSYYQSFKNVTNSSGRIHAAPQYKTVATLDTVTGYNAKPTVASQRRRRAATTF